MAVKISLDAEQRIVAGASLAELCRGRFKASVTPLKFVPICSVDNADRPSATSILNFGMILIDRHYTVDQAIERLNAEAEDKTYRDIERWRSVLTVYKRSKLVGKKMV